MIHKEFLYEIKNRKLFVEIFYCYIYSNYLPLKLSIILHSSLKLSKSVSSSLNSSLGKADSGSPVSGSRILVSPNKK